MKRESASMVLLDTKTRYNMKQSIALKITNRQGLLLVNLCSKLKWMSQHVNSIQSICNPTIF